MDKNEEIIDAVIDDLALGRYDSREEAIDDLILYGMDPDVAKKTVYSMSTIDVVP